MAEATAVVQKSSGVSTMVIVLLIVVLVGGGIGAWFMLKPKKKDAPETSQTPDTKDDGGVDSRNNTSSQYQGLTADQIANLFGTNLTNNSPGAGQAGSKEKPFFINDAGFQSMIDTKANSIQQHTETMDLIRNKYDIGKAIVTGQNQDSLIALKNMFSKRVDVNGNFPDMTAEKYWLSFPIYGTKELGGDKYRQDLQTFISKGWEGYNMTEKRHQGNPWWLPNMKFNLLVGTVNASTPSAHDVWMNYWSAEERDFYKGMNGHWKDDKDIADVFVNRNNPSERVGKTHSDARAAYCAGYMFSAVETWIAEIDRLDKAVRLEALRAIIAPKDKGGEGYYVSFLDPANPNANLYADYGLPNDYKPTNDTKPLIKPPVTA